MKITIYKDIQSCYEISTDEYRAAEEVVTRLMYYHNRFIVDTEYGYLIKMDTNYFINVDYERSEFEAVRKEWNEDVETVARVIKRDLDIEVEIIQ